MIFLVSSCNKETPVEYVENQTPLTQAIEESLKSCVGIVVNNSSGSGVIVLEDNDYFYIATCEHVVNNNKTVKVVLEDKSYVEGEVVLKNTEDDLAIIKSEKIKNLKSVKITKEIALPVIGDQVYAIGCPLSMDYYNTVTVGYISNIVGIHFYHSAIVNSGNSGGGIFYKDGTLLGINNMRVTQDANGDNIYNMSKSISISLIYDLLYKEGLISEE